MEEIPVQKRRITVTSSFNEISTDPLGNRLEVGAGGGGGGEVG